MDRSSPIETPVAPRVLVVAHDARATGGVNNFLRIMRRRMRGKIVATRFANGRRHGERGKAKAVLRLARDYLRFTLLLRRRRFDIVHVNPSLDLASMPRELLFVWLARLASPATARIIFYRGWDWQALDRVRGSSLGRRLFVATQRRADRILVLAESFRDALVALGVDRERIHIETTMFEGEMLEPVLAGGFDKHPCRLLFMSRFLPAKGGEAVIRAVAELADAYPDIELVMAGDGPQRAEWEMLCDTLGIADRVRFTGYIGGREKMIEFARASLFVLPTRHPEGMPNALLEAMAAGCVPITTAVGGIETIVTDGENGVILADPSPRAVADAVRRYLADPALAAATGRQNRKRAWTRWESSIVSDRIADHYCSVVRSRRPTRSAAADSTCDQ